MAAQKVSKALSHEESLHALLELTRKINSSLDPGVVYKEIVDSAVKLLGVDGAALRLLDARGLTLGVVASAGALKGKNLSTIPLGKSLSGKAALEKRAISVDTMQVADYAGTSGFRFISVAPVLLREHGDKLIGTLNTYHQAGRPLPKESLEILSILAENAANAAANAGLHEELAVKSRQLEIYSNTDFLTGLYNKRFFDSLLEKTLANAKRYGGKFALAIGDMDGFKKINDELGHATGDAALSALGALLLKNLRGGDFASRWGGDEFAFILPNADEAGAREFSEKLSGLFSEFSESREGRVLLNGRKLRISLGWAAFDSSAPNVEKITTDDILQAADYHLYAAKKQAKKQKQ
ncbi:MAG: sensor domain-containing diguanylate cyclase [Candidatus Micrarchaeia archaeon]|jgi:diguanylate cyclase (GGDEF)-like protein